MTEREHPTSLEKYIYLLVGGDPHLPYITLIQNHQSKDTTLNTRNYYSWTNMDDQLRNTPVTVGVFSNAE